LRKLLVLKFGGSVFSDASSILEAARFVGAAKRHHNIVVVVSALKGVTDNLLSLSRQVCENPSPVLLDQVLSMGERTSARMFCLALASSGVNCELVDVDTPYWPILTDSVHMDAEPLVDETAGACVAKMVPLIEAGIVPVVCGFIGLSKDGKVTTLGRGGSDTTATILGKCLAADEVVLIKDVSGVQSSDPTNVANVKKLDHLSLEEMQSLAKSGAKVVHEKALRYVDGYRLRITSIGEGLEGGTVIENDQAHGVSSMISATDVNMVTLVAPKGELVYASLLELLRDMGVTPISISVDSRSALFYTNSRVDENSLHKLVEKRLVKAVAVKRGLSCLTVAGPKLEDTPGVIARIAEPLYAHNINVYGLDTLGNAVKLFVSKDYVVKATEIISSSFGEIPKRMS
jgi:aspartate kinase